MRTSQFFLGTLKESPAEAEVTSHQLMLRAGLIRRVASGLYTWLPLGLRVLKRVEAIVREEMNKINALEILMPAIQPAELWQASGRWAFYGPELLRMRDRHDREFCFGPTHEEVITDLARRELRSYRQLPVTFYQIQMKFRDEIRPRFGVMRAREFIMKDAYSFHLTQDSLAETYQAMYEAYSAIFTRLGLKFRAVMADTGSIGGRFSHEFHVLANAGEDQIFYSDQSDYAANVELACAAKPKKNTVHAQKTLEEIATPGLYTIPSLSNEFKLKAKQTLKTLIVKGKSGLIALILRGDHQLNTIKAAKLPEIATPFSFATEAEILTQVGCRPGSIGPVGLKIPMIVDYAAAVLENFVCGANRDDFHYFNANWGRDVALAAEADLRNVEEGDESPDGKGVLHAARGIEVGHIFQLGDKYSAALNLQVLDEKGQNVTPTMGCYGIGVSRIVGAAIEQHHDARGVIWPEAMAPFSVVIVPVNRAKLPSVKEASDKLYRAFLEKNIDVLLEDRDERLGVMLSDMDLIGIPHRILISEKTLQTNQVEYKSRREPAVQLMGLDEVVSFIKNA